MGDAVLTISSKNYSSWSLRGWLLCRIAGLDFKEELLSADDPDARAELLMLALSFLVPRLTHNGLKVLDTLAIGEYLHENFPQADIERIVTIWHECLNLYGGPYVFGETPTLADAMYAPVVTRFATYDVKLDRQCADYCETILALPDMIECTEAARAERARHRGTGS